MILTDTSVVIVYERAPTPRLHKIITDNDAVVCGVTIAELFAGVKTAKDETKLRTALQDFQTIPIPDRVWETAGGNHATLRANGVTVPLIDTAIATVAIALGVELWAYDVHFNLMLPHLAGLRLFQEPP